MKAFERGLPGFEDLEDGKRDWRDRGNRNKFCLKNDLLNMNTSYANKHFKMAT